VLIKKVKQPPCAGITLIRFCGCNLSPAHAEHPGNLDRNFLTPQR